MHVYLIQNTVNGKCYVGQHAGEDLNWYLQENIKSALRGNKGKTLLYRAMRKYGLAAFTIRSIYVPIDKQDMDRAEITYIKFFGTRNPDLGYNCTDGGGGVLGLKWTDEQREANRQRAIERGIPEGFREGHKKYMESRVFSEEYRKNLSESRLGIQYSEETLKRMSESAKIRFVSNPELVNIQLERINKVNQIPEVRAKRAESNRHPRGPYKKKILVK